MAAGKSMIPHCSSAVRALRWRFTMFTPSTTTRPVFRLTRRILPSFPLSSPRSTRTVSPLPTGSVTRSAFFAWRARLRAVARFVARYVNLRMSEHLRRERYDLHEAFLAQLAGDGPEDARGPRLAGLVDDHDGVLVEADVAAVLAARFLDRAHDDGAGDIGLLHRAVRQRILHGHDHRAAQDADDERAFGARVVRDLDDGFLLNHGWSPLARAFDDLDHAPPLVLRQRPGLHDAHAIPRLGGVVLAVRFHALGARDHFTVQRVREATFDRHHHRFLHLVAHHDANPRLARAARRLVVRSHDVGHLSSLCLTGLPGGARGGGRRLRQLPLTKNRLHARNFLADHAEPERILERFRRAPKAQPEPLLFHFREPRPELVVRQLPNLLSPHRCAPPRGPRTSISRRASPPRAPSPSRPF